ncbi:hypothetical protein LBMAG42_21380 [Deltaproteobacteria bacterium]|nr:hypothetical protein LBMAG42_21380 [Deltaproteobacteria bacterium]
MSFTFVDSLPEHLAIVTGAVDLAALDILNPTVIRVQSGVMWLFAVDDGEGDLVWSAEQTRQAADGSFTDKVIMAVRCPPPDLATIIDADWTVLLTQAEAIAALNSAGYAADGISDHWHIYAHGQHWIAFSYSEAGSAGVPTGKGVGLIAFDANLVRTIGPVVLFCNDQSGGWGDVQTNDLCMMETVDGVTVVVIDRVASPNMPVFLHVPTASPTAIPGPVKLTDYAILLDSGIDRITNLGSAYYDSTSAWPYTLLLPITEEPPFVESRILALRLDSTFALMAVEEVQGTLGRSAVLVPGAPRQNLAMPMRVAVGASPSPTVWTWRERTLTEPPTSMSDAGKIRLQVRDSSGRRVYGQTLAPLANRPHLTAFRSQLIVAYDYEGGAAVWVADYAI